MDIKKERRARFLENLIKEAVVNVLVEKSSAVPPATTPPAQNMNPTDTDVVNPPPPPPQPAQPQTNQQQEKPFDVDEMVSKLNVLRGSKSFKDPEVYGRLTTFFKNLTDEQKNTLNTLLSELGKIVIDASEQQAGITQPQNQPPGRQPPGPGNPGTINQPAPPPPNAAPAPVAPAQ